MKDDRRKALAEFAAAARRCREEAGHPTARRFYQDLGGRPFFGCSCKAYLNLENGAGVPQPRLVERLVAGLRLAIGSRRVREFALAYLRLVFGEPELFDLAVAALRPKPARARRAVRPPPLSTEQGAALASGTGERLLEHPILLRASHAELSGYLPYFERRLAEAGRGSSGNEVFVIDADVVKLLDF